MRSRWYAALVVVLATSEGLWGQGALLDRPAAAADRIVVIREMDGPEQPCRLIRAWTMPEGGKACQVQVLDTEEILTIVEAGPAPAASPARGQRTVSARFYHWGNSSVAPPGVPVPPADAAPAGRPSSPVPGQQLPDPAPARSSSPVVPASHPLPAPKHTEAAALMPPSELPALPGQVTRDRAALLQCLTPAACAQVHRSERSPRVVIKPGGCVPVCPPYDAPNYGYHATQWRPWPGVTVPEWPASEPIPDTLPEPLPARGGR
jgi:hypothetical protein